MKNKIKVSEATERLSNMAMWGVILAFLLLFVLIPTKGNTEPVKALERIEMADKNPELRKYRKVQKKMKFKGYKKRKQWKSLKRK